MQYRRFGNTGLTVSALGFGCMRFPTRGSKADIEEEETIRMLRYAVDQGVNYIDTAYPYHDGNSEKVVGKALQDGYREKVYLATKLPSWMVQAPSDFDRFLNEQLERLQTDYVDCYLLHNLKRGFWEQVRDKGVFDWAERALADGRFRHLGFSFHDSYDVFREIVDYYDRWDFCQIQYNYLNENFQAGTKGLRYAVSKGLGVVVMEPLLGGGLAHPPEPIREMMAAGPGRRTPAEWGLQWVWHHPEVSVVLSGMSSMQQVEENLAGAERSAAGSLDPEELALVARLRDRYEELRPIPCTNCGYCLPCPEGVDIPQNLAFYNQAAAYGNARLARAFYRQMRPESRRAENCVQCGTCEEKCPQHIRISEWMPRVQQLLSSDDEQ